MFCKQRLQPQGYSADLPSNTHEWDTFSLPDTLTFRMHSMHPHPFVLSTYSQRIQDSKVLLCLLHSSESLTFGKCISRAGTTINVSKILAASPSIIISTYSAANRGRGNGTAAAATCYGVAGISGALQSAFGGTAARIRNALATVAAVGRRRAVGCRRTQEVIETTRRLLCGCSTVAAPAPRAELESTAGVLLCVAHSADSVDGALGLGTNMGAPES